MKTTQEKYITCYWKYLPNEKQSNKIEIGLKLM